MLPEMPRLKTRHSMRNRHKGRNTHLTAIILTVTGLFMACGGDSLYHSYRSIPTSGWSRQDTIVFHVHMADSFTDVRLLLGIRNRTNYPYQNLVLSVSGHAPDTTLCYSSDSLRLVLTDTDGNWTGKGLGELLQTEHEIGYFHIGRPGIYTFCIIPLLPDSLLPGINDIGLRMERMSAPQ